MLKKMRSKPENTTCCDCGSSDGMLWAVVNIGSFVCVRCASVHRGVGTHISKVKGLAGTYLWGPDEVQNMVGNARVSEVYGGTLPKPDASEARIRSFILDRYDKKCWYNMHAATQHVIPCAGDAQQQVHPIAVTPPASAHATRQQKSATMRPDFFDLLEFGEDAAPATELSELRSFGSPDNQLQAPEPVDQQLAGSRVTAVFDPFAPRASSLPAPAEAEEKCKQFDDAFDEFFEECCGKPSA